MSLELKLICSAFNGVDLKRWRLVEKCPANFSGTGLEVDLLTRQTTDIKAVQGKTPAKKLHVVHDVLSPPQRDRIC